eukprot:6020732-Amphidinium_carterae.1
MRQHANGTMLSKRYLQFVVWASIQSPKKAPKKPTDGVTPKTPESPPNPKEFKVVSHVTTLAMVSNSLTHKCSAGDVALEAQDLGHPPSAAVERLTLSLSQDSHYIMTADTNGEMRCSARNQNCTTTAPQKCPKRSREKNRSHQSKQENEH